MLWLMYPLYTHLPKSSVHSPVPAPKGGFRRYAALAVPLPRARDTVCHGKLPIQIQNYAESRSFTYKEQTQIILK